jgi:hypothetical protein
MFRFTGTIIRPNTKTQNWYIQPVCTLWDPILFTNCIGIRIHVYLLADVLKYIPKKSYQCVYVCIYLYIYIYFNTSTNRKTRTLMSI